ncbi:hypothetical protein IMPR6_690358 [Imperialibacter sp. EC-SDR9]|nr:hypothetical protein IMPERIA89_340359 [Imperialibacter sp. 89]CAD5297947.1 hypothetical protein IMPERIA75_700359 [Imperialibacter sp. 75]VVT34247.1 hypothetical protein IMPR6_690358 [Imperialibacter sp. EC-SDR9]
MDKENQGQYKPRHNRPGKISMRKKKFSHIYMSKVAKTKHFMLLLKSYIILN